MEPEKLKETVEKNLERTSVSDQRWETKESIVKALRRRGFKSESHNTDKLLEKLVPKKILQRKRVDGETKYRSLV